MIQVTVSCLTVSSHCMNLCRPIVSEVILQIIAKVSVPDMSIKVSNLILPLYIPGDIQLTVFQKYPGQQMTTEPPSVTQSTT